MKNEITKTEEYNLYLSALCRLASQYITGIRRQFADKAAEKFQDPTIRRLVLAYGEECRKLDADRLRDFTWASRDPSSGWSLDDSCLNNADHYAAAIKFLFDIQ